MSPNTRRGVGIVLTIASIAGTIATVVMAVKATPKAMELIEQKKEEELGVEEEKDLSIEDKVKTCWKVYIPAASVGLATVLSIAANGVLSAKSQASLIGAVGLAKSLYSRYSDKVKEIYGKEAHDDILSKIAAEEANPDPIYSPGLVGASCLDFENADEEQRLFYDAFGQRYFKSTFSKVLIAEDQLNRNYVLGAIPSLNDFYDFLGIDKIAGGDDLTWCPYANAEGFYWIDFNHTYSHLDEGLDCWIIDAVIPPEVNGNYWDET